MIANNRWDKYRVPDDNLINSSDKWGKYKVNNIPKGDSWPSLIGKSALKGLTSLADLPKFAAQGLEGISNIAARSHYIPGNIYGITNQDFENVPQTNLAESIPTSEDARKAINKYTGIDLEPHPTTGAQRVASHAAEFAGALSPFGMIRRGAGLANKAIGALKTAGTGGAIGGTSGLMQEGGINPLAADITSSFIAPTPRNLLGAFNKTKEAAVKIPAKIMGLTPKGFNLEGAQAARDLGIDLPGAALTNSRLTGLADQLIGKTPYFGNKLGQKYATAEQQTKDALQKIYEEVGPKKTPEIEAEISKLYDIRAKSLPQNAVVRPTHLDKAIDNIKINTAILSPDEKNLLNSLGIIKQEIKPESALVSNLGPIKLPLQEYSVDKLVGTKKSLNQIIKWDMDEGIKNQLRKVQHAVSQDIAEYGKTNPEWYKSFKEADDLFAKVAKREKLETKLGGSINPSTEDLGYAALSKRIHTPKQNELIKRDVSPEVFAKIEKLGKVSQAMAIKNRGVPNPSGTAPVSAVLGFLAHMYRPEALVGVIGTAAATKLLTDKKFLDLALKYAENPNASKLTIPLAINKKIKDITGVSAVILNQELNRTGE